MCGDWAGTLPHEPYCNPAGPARTADAPQSQTKKTEAKTSKSTEKKSADSDPPGEVPSAIRPPAETKQKVAFTTAGVHKCLMPFQVAEVERPLISVAQLTSAGNRVVLNDTGGQIVNAKTGKTIELVRRGGVYLLLMSIGVGVASDFPRQGK